jgi:isoquinoline 1-oxidoreductase subunit beta
MNKPIGKFETPVSRRQVMIGAAGLSFAIALPDSLKAAVLSSERTGTAINPWISIATDDTITIMSAATEMGQGSMTSLPLIVAEELDADWARVRIVPAPPLESIYGNPGFGGAMMYTAGSNAVQSYYTPLRIAGAQVRRVLLDNAARKWGVPVAAMTSRISWSSISTATPGCGPIRCAASASSPTNSRPRRSSTRWRANAASIRWGSASSS